jgi:hypothetical protein
MNDLIDDSEIIHKEQEHRMTSGFRREVDKKCSLLGDYRCLLRNNPAERSSQ